MQKLISITIIIFFIVSACAVTGKRPAERHLYENSGELINATLGNNLRERNFFISKAAVIFSEKGETQKFQISFKHKNTDSSLIIIRSLLGIEAARVLLTKDTVLINDRINKVLITGKPAELIGKYGLNARLMFLVLGDLVLNRNGINNSGRCEGGMLQHVESMGENEILYSIDCSRQKISKAVIREGFRNQEIDLEFMKERDFNGIVIPQKISIRSGDIDIRIEIERATGSWEGDIKFIPGNGYEVVRLK